MAVAGASTPAQSPPAAATREIPEPAGRHVRIAANVTRVADAWHANNAMVLMLGGAEKLVATTVQARSQPWLRRLYPRIDEVPAAFSASGGRIRSLRALCPLLRR